jgi:hypothetical protein
MTKKQTAVEWLVDQLYYDQILHPYYINQALEMEKEQIVDAFKAGDGDPYFLEHIDKYAERYYEKTYGK